MISYKRDVLERHQDRLEAIQSVKEFVKRLWNTLKTTFKGFTNLIIYSA